MQVRRAKTVAGFDTRSAAIVSARTLQISAFDGPPRAQVHILCVPGDRLEAAIEAVLGVVEAGNLIIVAAPVPPGTTRRVVGRRCRAHGLEPGRDVFVAFAPTAHTVGGLTDACTERAAAFFDTTVQRTGAEQAELARLAADSYRSLGVAFANELATLCDHVGADVSDIRRLANGQAEVEIPRPGPDGAAALDLLAAVARHDAPLLEAAREAHDLRPARIVARVRSMARRFVAPRIAVLGLGDPSAHRIAAMIAAEGLGTLSLADPRLDESPVPGHDLVDADMAVRIADIVVILDANPAFRRLGTEAFARPSVLDAVGLLDT
jgi:UDP-N-acetyl-D-mannosaminuronic acid dehydrogenase